MRGSQVACKFIKCVMPNEDTWGDMDHTVVSVEFLDGGASLRRVTFSEYLLKVTEQQFVNSFGHAFFSLVRFTSNRAALDLTLIMNCAEIGVLSNDAVPGLFRASLIATMIDR